MVQFDHETLRQLAHAGLPVPCPQTRPDGTSFLRLGNQVVEVLSWVEGKPFSPGDHDSVRNVGRFLARFHTAFADGIPPGKKGFLREDHPDLLLPYVRQLEGLCHNPDESEQVHRIGEQIELVRENLDHRLWRRLPKTVIHGDIHPGNVRFKNSCVSAIYDFDYLSVQAKVRDICDGLIFFAARRDSPLNPNDICSLTQSFTLDRDLSRILLGGYCEISKLIGVEWEAIPWVIRSQWAQFRLRGSRKVPLDKKISYVLDRFFEVVDWLDQAAPQFLDELREPQHPPASHSKS